MPPRILRAAVVTVAAVATFSSVAAGPAFAASKKPTSQAPRITGGPAEGSYVASQSATFTFTGSPANVTFTCQLDSGGVSVCKSPKTYSKLADGSTHTFRVRAQAPGKAVSAWVSRTWHVDLHVPAPPTITSSPATLSNSSKATFAFTGEVGATFACSLDGGSFDPCSSGVTTPALADGGHTFAVKQTARNGRTSAPTSFGWTIDTSGPHAPTINSGPAPASTVRPADVVFTFSDVDSTATAFLCAVTTGGAQPSFADCTAGSTYSNTSLGAGTYVFHVVAKDAAGNSSGEATRGFTVSVSAPVPPVVGGLPPAVTNNTGATFTVPSGVTCKLDGNSVDCSSGSFSATGLSDGAHTIEVTDTGTGAVTSYTWTVDTIPPAVPTLVNAPANGAFINNPMVVIGIDTDGKSTLTCTLDGNAIGCPGFLSTTLADGHHTVTVTAHDAAGNTASTSRTFTVDTVAPHVTFTLPAGLRSPVVASFGETVRGNASAVRLVLTDTGAAVPVATACVKGSSTVNCSGTFTSVRLTPTGRLLAGQHYTVGVPAGAVHDLAGNANAAASKAFRAARSLQEDAPGAVATWQSVKSSSAFGGSFVREHLRGAAAAWGFTGTSVTWWTVKGPNQGKAQIYVDGTLKSTVNNYAAATKYHVARTVSGLSAARHTVRIVVLQVKGATAGKGTFVAVDAFTVGKTLTGSPVLGTSWRRPASSHYSAGRAIVADLARESFTVSFRGVGVTWFTQRGPTQGKAQIWLDGVLKKTIDNYAASNTYGVARSLTKLADKVHTLKIVVLGQHRTGGHGNNVTVDRIAVA